MGAGSTDQPAEAWIHRGFDDFIKGRCEAGGSNLYVNAHGIIETIHRTDTNNDGFVDIVLPNSHGYIERGPTWIYTQAKGEGHTWPRHELPNDSCWMSRIVDVDGDGYADLVVVNAENGVTSELDSYVYWGGPNGLTGERTELPTAGAYDVAVVDLHGNGLPSLIFPSAWVDHHNRGEPRLIHVCRQVEPRRFVDVSEEHGLLGIAATAVACEDLNGDGRPELVVCNYRKEFEYDTDSYVYWGTEDGFDAASPLKLPSHYAMQAALGDLSGDGRKEIVFAGGNQIHIYWNDGGRLSPDHCTILEANGNSTMFCVGAIRVAIADVDGDGRNELLVAMRDGVEIRDQHDLTAVKQLLPLEYCGWVEAVDLDGDGRLDLIASKYHDGLMYETNSAIFWNAPDGFSADRITQLPTRGAVGCTAGDLDGDGRPEIVFNNTMGSWSQFNPNLPLYVYLGSAAHDYSPDRRVELPTGGGTETYVIADLDLDGHADLAFVSPDGVRVFHGSPDGLHPDRYTDLTCDGQSFGFVLTADLNRNGWLDLLAVPWTYDDKPETMAKSSVIYWGGPDGFSPERSTGVPTFAHGNGHLADVTGNGWLDFIYGDCRGYLVVYEGGPDGYSPQRMQQTPLAGTEGAAIVGINSADLNGDGWLDLIVGVMGHYTRKTSGFFVMRGGPDGFAKDRIDFHPTDASSVCINVADVNRDGHLDLLVPAYSTQFSRELPAHIYWGTDQGPDFENPLIIPCDASCAFMTVDITGNGYPDVLAVCHRNDIGHQVDSLLFWNGPEGLSFDRVCRLPGLGPHLASSRDFGNAYTREPDESYISPAYALDGRRPTRLHWDASTPGNTSIRFQLRYADAQTQLDSATWQGPTGEGSSYEQAGQEIHGVEATAKWLQYKAVLLSPDGCRSPALREVRIDMS